LRRVWFAAFFGPVTHALTEKSDQTEIDSTRLQAETELRLQIIAGDYNGDGTVNAADYTLWRNSRGAQVEMGIGADGNRNGFIDDGDYQLWKSFFGRVVVSGAAMGGASAGVDTAAVPEPICGALFAMGLVLSAALCRRRR
jgi:Dockerin type I domain